MGLESGTYIDDLVVTNPAGTDQQNQGDDHLRLIKTILKNSFSDVDTAVGTIHQGVTAPASPVTNATLWWDTTNSVFKYYDGSSWIRVAANITEAQNSAFMWAGTVAGTADALTATLSPVPAAYAAGQQFVVIAASTNTGAATIDFNGLGAKAITKNGSTALVASDIIAGRIYFLTYDGTQFEVANPGDVETWTGFMTSGATGQSLMMDAAGTGSTHDIPAHTCEGRLTLTSGVPLTTADVTSATTVYFTPYKGNRITLYDTGALTWKSYRFSELSIAVPASTDTMYDLFVYDNSGTLTLEAVAWTNDTTRATSHTLQNGVHTKTGATNKRYVGSFRTTSVSGRTEDSQAKRWLASWAGHEPRAFKIADAVNNHTYASSTLRQWQGSTIYQTDFICCLDSTVVKAQTRCAVHSTVIGSVVYGLGLNSRTAIAGDCINGGRQDAHAGSIVDRLTAGYHGMPGAGRNYLAMVQGGVGSGTVTWYGDDGALNVYQSGIIGEVMA